MKSKRLMIHRGGVMLVVLALTASVGAGAAVAGANCTQLDLDDCDTERGVTLDAEQTVTAATKGVWVTTPFGKVGADKVSNPGFDLHLDGISYGSLSTKINPDPANYGGEYECAAVDDPANETFNRLIEITPQGGGELFAILYVFWTETDASATDTLNEQWPLHVDPNTGEPRFSEEGGVTLTAQRGDTLAFHVCIF